MVIKISLQAAHEQVNPKDLLDDAEVMDKSGIGRCWTSDHYMPWWHTSASCGAAWPWLGAALARTKNISIGTGVTAPILRYNPAVVAQVFATLDYMFPGRAFIGLGTGESLNEVPSGNAWPSSAERLERLHEAIMLMKNLWNEEYVDFEGRYYTVKKSNLYTKPTGHIPLYIAAMGRQAAGLAGELADGLVTNELDPQLLQDRIMPGFREGAKKAGRDHESLEKVAFMHAAYDEDKEKALAAIRPWKGAMIKAFFEVDFPDPRDIEENGKVVGDDVVEKHAIVMTSAEEGIKKLQKYADLGFTEVVLTNCGPDRNKLVKLLAGEVIPALAGKAKAAQAS